ncbi:glycosyltransferase [Cryobacterium breve]
MATELICTRGFEQFAVQILGYGPDFDAMRARIRSRGIAKSVRVYGHADVQTIRSALHDSVLVSRSRLPKGFQITLLEAAAAGAQIVSFPVPKVHYLSSDGCPSVKFLI